MKRALTAAAVERLKPPKTGQEMHYDQGFPGLALRISYAGSKTWTLLYRLRGKQARMTLGHWPAMSLAEAREAWRNAREHVHKGETPRPKATEDLFEDVCDEWFRRDQGDNRSVEEVRRVFNHDVKPHWDGRLFATITRRDALDIIDAVADRGAVTKARRLHAHLHRLFKWAVGRGVIEANPLADAPKPGAAVKRDRVLSDDELKAVWSASCAIEYPFGPMFRLLILTGARRDEMGSLRWSEIDGDVIRLSGERTKNGEPHDIPLSPEALDIIKGLPRIGHNMGGEFVFTTTGDTPVSGFSKAKRLLDRAMLDELYDEAIGYAWLPAWRIHDLRRTVATNMQRLGINLQVVEECLGHISGSRAGVVGVYQRHGYSDEKRVALGQWARKVMGNGEGKVIPLVRPQI